MEDSEGQGNSDTFLWGFPGILIIIRNNNLYKTFCTRPINSQEYKSFDIYAVTIKISMTESGPKLTFYFGGLLFTSHWLNLQHWTCFYIAVYGSFQGLFFDFQGLFFALRGRNRPESHVIFSLDWISPLNKPSGLRLILTQQPGSFFL